MEVGFDEAAEFLVALGNNFEHLVSELEEHREACLSCASETSARMIEAVRKADELQLEVNRLKKELDDARSR